MTENPEDAGKQPDRAEKGDAGKSAAKDKGAGKKGQTAVRDRKPGVFARMLLFIRQVIAELRKVVWPTREELSTYFIVVIVFVVAVMAFIGIVDLGLGWLVGKVFG